MSRHRSHQRQSRPSSDQIEGLRLKPCCGRRMAGFTGHAELPPGWVYPRRRLILKFAACALTNISSNKATKKANSTNAKEAFVLPRGRNWIINDRLTLEYGVRFDRDTIAKENNLAPRLACAFNPISEGRTVVRGEALGVENSQRLLS